LTCNRESKTGKVIQFRENRGSAENTKMPTTTIHIPVLFQEVLDGLNPQPGEKYLDGTLGGAGHTLAIAQRVGHTGLVIGMDRDSKAIDAAKIRIQQEEKKLGKLPIRTAYANYRDFPEVLELLNVPRVNGFLLDLGLSSDQLADEQRGFSFQSDGELDLRFDVTEGVPAYVFLNRWSEKKIADTIFQYGEERQSRRIARMIVQRRQTQPFRYARELAEICRRAVPVPPWSKQHIDPATRTFQALRIAVNNELDSLTDFLKRAPAYLELGGKIAVISFHSLEDRIVKNAFRDDETLEIITRKPITASEAEVSRNPRSRSAKLRIAKKR